ncbi:DUF4262 domain-containing protein [Croceicoccus sp. Ery5]|uniref:DUF4262 domain-containing protein n=1 Tax=Croceicoccus sp. Ery5 TaxID=1703340 RepID=UPI001E64FC36|nr:DUF4262 domain-containing protein [Croceicoccus sp. Ery5]
MRTALNAPPNTLDEDEQSFVAKIREHGWFRTGVLGDDDGPGFSFTTGLFVNTGQPELLIFSMKDRIAHDVFWDLYRDAKDGRSLPVGRRTEAVFGNAPAYAFRIAKEHYRDLLGWSRWFYGGDVFPCLQIVWPDREGRFPWEEDFADEFAGLQKDMTESGWKNELAD